MQRLVNGYSNFQIDRNWSIHEWEHCPCQFENETNVNETVNEKCIFVLFDIDFSHKIYPYVKRSPNLAAYVPVLIENGPASPIA